MGLRSAVLLCGHSSGSVTGRMALWRPSSMCHTALILLSLPRAASWITSAQWIPDYTAQTLARVQAMRGAVNRLWTAPAHWTEPDGLGSGIT